MSLCPTPNDGVQGCLYHYQMPPKALLQGFPAFTLLSEGSLGPVVTHGGLVSAGTGEGVSTWLGCLL